MLKEKESGISLTLELVFCREAERTSAQQFKQPSFFSFFGYLTSNQNTLVLTKQNSKFKLGDLSVIANYLRDQGIYGGKKKGEAVRTP